MLGAKRDACISMHVKNACLWAHQIVTLLAEAQLRPLGLSQSFRTTKRVKGFHLPPTSNVLARARCKLSLLRLIRHVTKARKQEYNITYLQILQTLLKSR